MTCDLCEGSGWVVIPDGGAGTAKPCACRSGLPIEERMLALGIPRDLVYSKPYLGEPPADLARFPSRAHFLTLTGATGRGKSRVAADLVRTWLAGGCRARWWEVEELLRAIRARFGLEPGPESVIEPLLNPKLMLVLDEAWANQGTDWADGEVSRLIRRRHRDQGPTILTTNLNERQAEELEPRLHSRMWGSLVVPLGGPDFRRLAATAAGGR